MALVSVEYSSYLSDTLSGSSEDLWLRAQHPVPPGVLQVLKGGWEGRISTPAPPASSQVPGVPAPNSDAGPPAKSVVISWVCGKEPQGLGVGEWGSSPAAFITALILWLPRVPCGHPA